MGVLEWIAVGDVSVWKMKRLVSKVQASALTQDVLQDGQRSTAPLVSAFFFKKHFHVITLRRGHPRPREQLLLLNYKTQRHAVFFKRYLNYRG